MYIWTTALCITLQGVLGPGFPQYGRSAMLQHQPTAVASDLLKMIWLHAAGVYHHEQQLPSSVAEDVYLCSPVLAEAGDSTAGYDEKVQMGTQATIRSNRSTSGSEWWRMSSTLSVSAAVVSSLIVCILLTVIVEETASVTVLHRHIACIISSGTNRDSRQGGRHRNIFPV